MHGRGDEARRVVVHAVVDPLGKALRQFLHLVLDALLQIKGIRARHLIDRQHHRRVFAEECRGGVLERSELDAGNIAEPHDRSGAGIRTHHDVAELGGITQPANRIHLQLEGRTLGCRRLADLARSDLHILLCDGILHVDRSYAQTHELVGIEPDAHRVAPLAEDLDVADARQALQRIDDLQIAVVAERHRIDGSVRRGEIDDENEVRILLLDRHPGLIDDWR